MPFIQNFDITEYGGSPQNWAITQGSNGIIYVGNGADGILAFDGTRWRKIRIPNQLTVRSLTTSPNGRIYVGTIGDFGYLKPNETGGMTYVSLLNKVPTDARDFSDVWRVHATATDVYFATLTRLFHLRGGKISIIDPATSFHLSFLVNGTLYIREVGHGLMRLVGDDLELIPGGERFADMRIYALLPLAADKGKNRPNRLLIGTRSHGWFVYDNGSIQPWQTDASARLNKAFIYWAIWLTDGRLAVATLRDGLYILDRHGKLVRHLSRKDGLPTNMRPCSRTANTASGSQPATASPELPWTRR